MSGHPLAGPESRPHVSLRSVPHDGGLVENGSLPVAVRLPSRSEPAAADFAVCREILRRGSRSFSAAFHLLPRAIRPDIAALYAFCRRADDAVDREPSSGAALSRLQGRVEAIYLNDPGDPDDPVERSFAALVRRHRIPRDLPAALLEGFRWDLEGRRYETLAELRGYAVRVAATVGVMMALVMGVRGRHVLARACDLGVAMQLTNIARDVGEDAARGRLYLPLAPLRAAGVDPAAWLRQPVFSPAIAQAVAAVLDEADRLYRRAAAGVPLLPGPCRAAVAAAALIYADIGRVIRGQGLDSVTHRAYTSRSRKLLLLLTALWRCWRSRSASRGSALPAGPPVAEAAPLLDRGAGEHPVPRGSG